MIVGITGKKTSGKSTAAGFLVERGFRRLSFASTLKTMVHVLLCDMGFSPDEVIGFEADKEALIPMIGVSYRSLCQTLGTEWGREHVHPDLWTIVAGRRVSAYAGDVVFDDVRFDNDARMIRDSGGLVIHLHRPGLSDGDGHLSERGVMFRHDVDVMVDNYGGTVLLAEMVLGAVERFQERSC